MKSIFSVSTILLFTFLAGCSSQKHGAKVKHVQVNSHFVSGSFRQEVVIPDGAVSENRSLLLFLFGRNSSADKQLSQQFFDALHSLSKRAPVVVFVAGSKDSYWHDRRNGRWGSYLLREVLPKVVQQFKINPRRIAIGGISMGGFGALDLARLNPKRFCAVGSHSPAIWQTGAETAAGAFDDAEDFANHNLVSSAQTDPARFQSTQLWVDAGKDDPFDPGVKAFTRSLQMNGIHVSLHRWAGGHNSAYWNAHWDEYLRFYAHALERCGER